MESGGGALTGGVSTRGADCVDCEPASIDSVGSLDSVRSRTSVAKMVAKKAVNIETTSTGVSIFRAEPGRSSLLESGGRFLDMGNG